MPFSTIPTPDDKNIIKAIKELQGSMEDLKESSDEVNNSMIWLTRVLVILTIVLSLPVLIKIIEL